MVRISIDETDALQVLKDYGKEAYNAFRAKRLRCTLHPEEERAIYVEPKKYPSSCAGAFRYMIYIGFARLYYLDTK
jgi:hypothetical protein